MLYSAPSERKADWDVSLSPGLWACCYVWHSLLKPKWDISGGPPTWRNLGNCLPCILQRMPPHGSYKTPWLSLCRPPQCPHCGPRGQWREAHNAIHTLLPRAMHCTLAQNYTVQIWKAKNEGMHGAHRTRLWLRGGGSKLKLYKGGKSQPGDRMVRMLFLPMSHLSPICF